MDNKKKSILIGATITVVTIVFLSYVFRDKVKAAAKATLGDYKWFNDSLKWYRDNKSTRDIVEKLHPQFQPLVKEFFSRVEKELGLQMYATSGLRTFERQAQLKKEDPKNAAPGLSDHNYGFAVDVNVIDPKTGKIILNKQSPAAAWEKSGILKIAKEMGIRWGGTIKNYYDPVHFEIDPKGLKGSQLLALKNSGKVDANGYVIV